MRPRRAPRLAALLGLVAALTIVVPVLVASDQAPAPGSQALAGKAPAHATQVKRLLIRNAMVIYGNAKPRVRAGGHPRAGRPDRPRRRRRRKRPGPPTP